MNETNKISLKGFQYLILSRLGLNRDNALVMWLLLISGAIFSWGLWQFDGNLTIVISLLVVAGIIILSFLRVDYSLYLLIFFVLLFDQFGIPNYEPWTHQIEFFKNVKEIRFIPFFEGGMFNPIEVMLSLILLSLFLILGIKKDFQFRKIPLPIPFAMLFFSILFAFQYGMSFDGDFMVALWEVRALFYFFIMYLIVPQIIRDKKQIKILIWVFIAAISFKAFQGVYRFLELGFTTGGRATLTNHEDPIFFITLFMLLLGFVVFKVKNSQKFWLLLLSLPLLLGFYVGLRRAAYASLFVSLLTFVVILPPLIRWKFIKSMVPVLIGIIVYSAVFWNYDGKLGRPIQMVMSGFEEPTKESNVEDYYSNLYRDIENFNLAQTVKSNPVMGIGFGNKYDQPISMVSIRFPLRDFIPHNEIIWILVKTGVIGFTAFWLFFNFFVAKGINVMSRLKDPYLKSVLIMVIIAVISQMVVSYYDLQLTYYRNMIYLGCLLGLLSPISQYANEDGEEEEEI